MNGLVRWDPFRELDELHDRLSSMLNRPGRGAKGDREAMTLAEWAPSVDITEDDKEYVIKADLPEVKKEDVKVRVDEGMLTVRGERKMEKEEKGKKYHRVERAYGSFARSFVLPEDAEADKVRAEFKEGLLLVHLPKNPAAKPRAREIAIS